MLWGELKEQIILDWSTILKQKGHRGISEKTLSTNIFDKSKKGIFTEQYDRIDICYDNVMKTEIFNYDKNPYPFSTKDEFKTKAKIRVEEKYSNLILEIKKINKDHVVDIILPKLKEKITKPY